MTNLTIRQKKLFQVKEFEDILADRHTCDTECIYFHKCPLAYGKARKETKCRVRELPDDQIVRYLTFFIFDETGLRDEAFRILFKVGQVLNLRDDAREMNMYLDMLLKIIRTFRIDVNNVSGLDEPISINIKDFGSDKPLDPAEKVWRQEGVVLMEDPESLVHSATLIEKFMTPPSQTSDGSRKRAVFVPKEELVKVKL